MWHCNSWHFVDVKVILVAILVERTLYMGEILQAISALIWIFRVISFVKDSKPIACFLINLVVLNCIILFIPLSTFVWTGSNLIFWSCHPSLSIPVEVGLVLHVVFLSVRMQSKCLTLIPNTNYQLLSDTCHSHCQRRGKFCSQFCWFEAPVVLVYLQSISLLWVV